MTRSTFCQIWWIMRICRSAYKTLNPGWSWIKIRHWVWVWVLLTPVTRSLSLNFDRDLKFDKQVSAVSFLSQSAKLFPLMLWSKWSMPLLFPDWTTVTLYGVLTSLCWSPAGPKFLYPSFSKNQHITPTLRSLHCVTVWKKDINIH